MYYTCVKAGNCQGTKRGVSIMFEKDDCRPSSTPKRGKAQSATLPKGVDFLLKLPFNKIHQPPVIRSPVRCLGVITEALDGGRLHSHRSHTNSPGCFRNFSAVLKSIRIASLHNPQKPLRNLDPAIAGNVASSIRWNLVTPPSTLVAASHGSAGSGSWPFAPSR
jgi:hypothetical protein